MARTPSPIARSSAAKSGACGTPLKPAPGLATLDPGGANRARQPVNVLTIFGIPIVRPRPQPELHPRRAVIAGHELGTGVNEPRQRPIRRAEIAEELVKLLFCLRLRNGGSVADRLNKLSAGLCGVRPGYVDVPDIDTGLSSAGHHRESAGRQGNAGRRSLRAPLGPGPLRRSSRGRPQAFPRLVGTRTRPDRKTAVAAVRASRPCRHRSWCAGRDRTGAPHRTPVTRTRRR
jgi:hypothetical protein